MLYCRLGSCKPEAYLGAQVRTSNHRLDEQPVSVRTPEGIIATGCDKLGCYIGKRSRLGVQVIILLGELFLRTHNLARA